MTRREGSRWGHGRTLHGTQRLLLGPISTPVCLQFDLSTSLFAVQELVWRPDVIPEIVQADMTLESGKLFAGGALERGA